MPVCLLFFQLSLSLPFISSFFSHDFDVLFFVKIAVHLYIRLVVWLVWFVLESVFRLYSEPVFWVYLFDFYLAIESFNLNVPIDACSRLVSLLNEIRSCGCAQFSAGNLNPDHAPRATTRLALQ